MGIPQKNYELRIRSAQRADLQSYVDLLEEIAEWLYSQGLGPLQPGIHRDSWDYYAGSIAVGEVYLAFLGADMVGSFRLLHEDPIIWPEADSDAPYLHSLVVRRSWSGHGLGRQLLGWAEERAASLGKNHLRLDCFANNQV